MCGSTHVSPPRDQNHRREFLTPSNLMILRDFEFAFHRVVPATGTDSQVTDASHEPPSPSVPRQNPPSRLERPRHPRCSDGWRLRTTHPHRAIRKEQRLTCKRLKPDDSQRIMEPESVRSQLDLPHLPCQRSWRKVGIDQSHVQRRMTEQFLQRKNVSPLLYQETCKRVAQCVPGSYEVRTVRCGQQLPECNHSHLTQRTDQQRWCTERLPRRELLCKRQWDRQRPWLPILWESFIGVRHRQSVIHQIHILPAQAEDFSAP